MKKTTHQVLEQLAKKLQSARRYTLLDRVTWHNNVPSAGGVYVIWNKKDKKAAYVGETCHLNHRFGDLERTVNHTFRRKVAAIFKAAPGNEILLSRKISRRFSISYLPLEFGRKELEDYLVLKWTSTIMNKPAKRLRLSEQYRNIERF